MWGPEELGMIILEYPLRRPSSKLTFPRSDTESYPWNQNHQIDIVFDVSSNTANVSSLMYHTFLSLPKPLNSVNWVGFYVVSAQDVLAVGPFQGKVACTRIELGKGVCGAAAEGKKTVIVHDVHDFPGHIACDSDSESEIVVPIIKDSKVSAIISCNISSYCPTRYPV